MSRPPLILTSTMNAAKGAEFSDDSTSLSHWYTRTLAKAGGAPALMPNLADKKLIQSMVERCDGVMLTGGDDLHPDLYDPQLPKKIKATAGGIDADRDLSEFLLIEQVLQQHKPLLAICRGPQVLNVALGGGLITDIPLERPGSLDHRRKAQAHRLTQTIAIESGSLMHKIFRKRSMKINSAHHQAVGNLAPMLRATAHTRDGILEAIELNEAEAQTGPFLLGMQFHPERLWERYPEFLKPFRAFIKACRP